MERLSGQDAYFLYRETRTVLQHTLKVAVYQPPATPRSYDEVKASIARHLHLIPPLRRRLVAVPLGLHHPVWIEDPDFELDFHIRRAGVPAPGGPRELDEMISEIANHALDRSRPLWELWLLEGLAGGRQAAVLKIHHALADGVASAALMDRTAARSADVGPPPPENAWQPEPVPSRWRLVRDALAEWIRLLARLPALLAKTARGLRRLAAARREARVRAPLAWESPHLPFNTALSRRRVFATTSFEVEDCRRIKQAFGVTLNDVVLALCAGSLRRWLAACGELPARPLIASIPVSGDEEEGRAPRLYGNRVAYLQTALHVEIADPVERMLATREVTLEAKRELELMGRNTVIDWMEYLPAVPYTLLKRLQSRLRLADIVPSPSNLVVSNVSGPRERIYWNGAQLAEFYSVGPLSEGIGLNLTLWSYCDRMYCALLACRDQISDPHAITRGLHEELRELLGRAQQRAAEPRREQATAEGGCAQRGAAERSPEV
jgi:diacylglycerol O-acyltransferase